MSVGLLAWNIYYYIPRASVFKIASLIYVVFDVIVIINYLFIIIIIIFHLVLFFLISM